MADVTLLLSSDPLIEIDLVGPGAGLAIAEATRQAGIAEGHADAAELAEGNAESWAAASSAFANFKTGGQAAAEAATSEGDFFSYLDGANEVVLAVRDAVGSTALPTIFPADKIGTDDASNVQSHLTILNRVRRLHPQDFAHLGDPLDPAEAHLPIRAMLEASASEKLPALIERPYELKRGLVFPDYSIIEITGDGWLRNSLTAAEVTSGGLNAQDKAAAKLGRMHPVWLPYETGNDGDTGSWTAHFTWHELDDIVRGDPAAFTTSGDMANFTDGQVVLVGSGEYSSNAAASGVPGKSWTPHTLVATVMVKGSSGEWQSLYPLPPMTDPKVTNLVTATTDWDGVAPHIARGVRIYGGRISSDEHNAFIKTGFLGCDIHLEQVDGEDVFSFNAGFFSQIRADRADATGKMAEIACCSYGLDIEINSGTYRDDGSGIDGLRMGERTQNCRIVARNVAWMGRTGAAAVDLLKVNAGRRNEIRIEGGRITGNWGVLMVCTDTAPTDSLDPNASQARCDLNHLSISPETQFNDATCQRVFWDKSDYDWGDAIKAVRDNRYSGAVSLVGTVEAGRIQGHRVKLGDDKALVLAGGAINLISGGGSGHELNIDGPVTWTGAGPKTKCAKLRLGGYDMVGYPDAESSPTGASVNYTIDLSKRVQRITLADAGTTALAFNAHSNAFEGARSLVEVLNSTGAAITATAASPVRLGAGVTFPSLGNDDAMLLEVVVLKFPGSSTFRTVIRSIEASG